MLSERAFLHYIKLHHDDVGVVVNREHARKLYVHKKGTDFGLALPKVRHCPQGV